MQRQYPPCRVGQALNTKPMHLWLHAYPPATIYPVEAKTHTNILYSQPVTWCMMLSALPALQMLNVAWQVAGPVPTMHGLAKTVGRCRLGPEYYSQVALTSMLLVGMH